MKELRALVEAARAARSAGQELALATVVDVQGSGYRRTGARMLFSASAWLAGSVSGGCLERDILNRGFWLTRAQPAALVTYDAASDERRGTGCDGIIRVLIQRLSDASTLDPLRAAERCLHDERGATLATVYRARSSSALGASTLRFDDGHEESSAQLDGDLLSRLSAITLGDASPGFRARVPGRVPTTLDWDDLGVFVEHIAPPIHLFVFGTAHDAQPLVQLGRSLGWSVSVCAPDARSSLRARFPQADRVLGGELAEQVRALDACCCPVAVVMQHHYERDLATLVALARARARYVGVLGARSRAARLVADLRELGVAPGFLQSLRAPVGLDLGAEGPAEIALSIVAEIQAHVRGADARPRHAATESAPVRRQEPVLRALKAR